MALKSIRSVGLFKNIKIFSTLERYDYVFNILHRNPEFFIANFQIQLFIKIFNKIKFKNHRNFNFTTPSDPKKNCGAILIVSPLEITTQILCSAVRIYVLENTVK